MILLLTFTINRAIIVTVKSKQQPREGRKDHTMTYNHTITKAAEIIGVALVSAGIAADGWTMQIISAAPVGADADRYTVAVYQPRHRIPSTVWALTIDTAHDGWTIAARTMECIYNRDTMGADIAPRHALTSAITGRIRITAPAAETETAETTETTPAAEPETETAAETETAERAAKVINPMCAECVKRGASCPGTTCHSFTGCIYRETLASIDSPTERGKTPAHITGATTAKLLDYWDYARRLSYSAATALTRGWILDELERRDPIGFAQWLDLDVSCDETLRDYIRPDDAHVAWLTPQCDVTWHPGDATREGARA